MNKKKLIALIVGILLVATVLTIIIRKRYTQSSQTVHKNWQKLRIGYLPVAAELPLFVAVEQGYFKKAGIDIDLVRFASSNELGNAATADQIDILAGCASNVVFDIGHVSGKKHLVFLTNPYSNTPGH